jgi:Uncharacterized oxidoreductases, Fe-dependent alcohol dehydrogenase family
MLGNFSYSNPTKLYFGEDSIKYLQEELANYGERVLLIYGGGSIKKIGLYDEVLQILKTAGKEVIEDTGVMPNPTLEKVEEGIKIGQEHEVDMILAVGGGSVIDYAKVVSVGIHAIGDVWERFFLNEEDVTEKVIPVGAILTMAGTGSEMNGGSVITNTATNQKIGRVFGDSVFPKFSILNPVYTYSVPEYQLKAGIFDVLSHIMEQYFCGFDDNVSDYLSEGLMRSLIVSSRVAVKNPTDYEARSNIMWASTWALNTLVGKGKPQDWMVHMIGHSISGVTDATHGMALAAVSLPYYRLIMSYGLEKFKRFAINVWNVRPEGKSDEEIAEEGLLALENWMKEIGVILDSRKLDVTEANIDQIAKNTFILDGGYKVLSLEDLKTILKESME